MTTIDHRRLERIRWRCRRGMLENDLVLTRFLAAAGESLTEEDVAHLDALLDMTDNALWDMIAGRIDPDPGLAEFVARLRSV
jgi:antitoxin CptB